MGRKNASHRAARADPSLRKERFFGMTIKVPPPSIAWPLGFSSQQPPLLGL